MRVYIDKVLNQAVKRNKERFPVEFMFKPDIQELANLKSQIVTTYTHLSEEMRAELDNIYNAIGALSMKYQEPPKPKMNPIGYEATAARYEEEERRKKDKQ